MSGFSKTIIAGNLGKDPEIRYTPDGKAITSFSVATSEQWKDKTSGEMKERTEWHRVVVFGKQAETCGQYLSKGSKVIVEGQNRTRSWEADDGVKRYVTEVVVDFKGGVTFMGGGDTRDTGGSPGPGTGRQYDGSAQSGGKPFDPDDDIPF